MLVLITGGSASGKSELSEQLAVNLNKGRLAYIATMAAYDEEGRSRVAKHKLMRQGKGFETLEIPYDLQSYLHQADGYHTILLECVPNLILNEMFIAGRDSETITEVLVTEVFKLIDKAENLILVSGSLYSGYQPYDEFTDRYIEVLGQTNCEIARSADSVIEVVCSIPIIHKGEKSFYENIL